MKFTRQQFLRSLGLGATVAFASSTALLLPTRQASALPEKETDDLKLALASYTLRKFPLDEVIRVCQRLALSGVALKSMHMPLESSAGDVKVTTERIRAAGLNLYGAGVIYMKTVQDVESAFA